MSNNNPNAGWGNSPQQPYAPLTPQEPKKGKTGKVIGFGCLGIVALIVVFGIIAAVAGNSGDNKADSKSSSTPKAVTTVKGGGNSAVSSGDHPAAADVKITSCEVAYGLVTAKITIVNHSSKASDYLGSVYFMDGQTRTGDGAILVSNVPSGQKVLTTSAGTSDAHGKITCVLGDDLKRTASFN